MSKLHSPDHDCAICERLNLGVFAYREIAAELGTDDPEIIDPIWRARCEARIVAYRAGRIEEIIASDSEHGIEPAAARLAIALLPRSYAAA